MKVTLPVGLAPAAGLMLDFDVFFAALFWTLAANAGGDNKTSPPATVSAVNKPEYGIKRRGGWDMASSWVPGV